MVGLSFLSLFCFRIGGSNSIGQVLHGRPLFSESVLLKDRGI